MYKYIVEKYKNKDNSKEQCIEIVCTEDLELFEALKIEARCKLDPTMSYLYAVSYFDHNNKKVFTEYLDKNGKVIKKEDVWGFGGTEYSDGHDTPVKIDLDKLDLPDPKDSTGPQGGVCGSAAAIVIPREDKVKVKAVDIQPLNMNIGNFNIKASDILNSIIVTEREDKKTMSGGGSFGA